MRHIKWLKSFLIIIFVFVIGKTGWAESEDAKFNPINITEIIKIENGINYIDLNGDGTKDMIVSGHRHNITAHSFQIYSVYINDLLKFDENTFKWQIVAIEDEGKESYLIATNEGTGCILKDIRLIRMKGDKEYYLVIAERLPTKTYIDKEFVIFKFYKLVKDQLENRWIYKKTFESKSKKKYCDVNEALAELKRK